MKLLLATTIGIVGILAIPATSFAATYEYVNVTGHVSVENAPDLSSAFVIPTDISPTSGVMLVSDTTQMIPVGMYVGN